MTLTTWDDFPVHQSVDFIRRVATTDRNAYDRYYFNFHSERHDTFVVVGMGVYPNLGTKDAFVLIRKGKKHHVLRASAPLHDRADMSVGPIKVDIVKGLQHVKLIADFPDEDFSMNVDLIGEHFPIAEERQIVRHHERVMFDMQRFAQNGYATGRFCFGGDHIDMVHGEWIFSRDRSWGVRPVGEEEPKGIQHDTPSMKGMWNWFPGLFDDCAFHYVINQTEEGRPFEFGALMFFNNDGHFIDLGEPVHEHVFNHCEIYRSRFDRAVVRFPDSPLGEVKVVGIPWKDCYITTGAGYGLEPDWRHGMYHGPEAKVDYLKYDVEKDADAMLGVNESPCTWELSINDEPIRHGKGMLECGFFSHVPQYMDEES